MVIPYIFHLTVGVPCNASQMRTIYVLKKIVYPYIETLW